MTEQFSKDTNYALYIDLKSSARYLKMLEPVERDDTNLLIKVELKAVVPANTRYIVECHRISKGECI